MRIAYLSHFYPPAPCGGAGYYTANLAEGFQARGNIVTVLCAGTWDVGTKYLNGFDDEEHNSIRVRRLHINWRKADRPFDCLYDSPDLGEQVRRFLHEFEPDIVHVASMYTLSARSVSAAKGCGVPVIIHLHDYWTICARLSLLHKDGRICTGPEEAWKCQSCALESSDPQRLVDAFVPAAAQRYVWKSLQKSSWLTRQPGLIGMLGDYDRRRQFVHSALAAADLLVVPTKFARDVLVAHGVPATTMMVIPYGTNSSWAEGVRPVPSDSLRIIFLGNILPKKGVHILTEAFGVLKSRGYPATLQIWGNTTLAPAYFEELKASAHPEIRWNGAYSREDLASILSNADLVVVPSVWYETQGIVIQEAFAAGVPVVVSDGTSLTETVRDNVDGLYFKLGAVGDLAAKLANLIEDPELLPRLRSNIPMVRSIEEDINQYSQLYTELLREHRAPSDVDEHVA